MLLTVSFTVERYIAVCHPLRGRVLCTESRAKRVILIVALFCIACTATTPHEWHVALDPVTNKFQKSSTELGRNDIYKKAYNWFCIVTFICVPLLVLAVLNWFLINAVNRSRRNRTRLTCQVSLWSFDPERRPTSLLSIRLFDGFVYEERVGGMGMIGTPPICFCTRSKGTERKSRLVNGESRVCTLFFFFFFSHIEYCTISCNVGNAVSNVYNTTFRCCIETESRTRLFGPGP